MFIGFNSNFLENEGNNVTHNNLAFPVFTLLNTKYSVGSLGVPQISIYSGFLPPWLTYFALISN